MGPVKQRPLWVPPEQDIISFRKVFLISLWSSSWARFVAQLPYPALSCPSNKEKANDHYNCPSGCAVGPYSQLQRLPRPSWAKASRPRKTERWENGAGQCRALAPTWHGGCLKWWDRQTHLSCKANDNCLFLASSTEGSGGCETLGLCLQSVWVVILCFPQLAFCWGHARPWEESTWAFEKSLDLLSEGQGSPMVFPWGGSSPAPAASTPSSQVYGL